MNESEQIINVTKTQRKSNIELLRIIAMFLVLVLHTGFATTGVPTNLDFIEKPFQTFIRCFAEGTSIICVDVFVLISGWFGINPRVRSLCNFIFQCLFFLIGIYIFFIILGISTLNSNGILGMFAMTKWNWFIKAYIGIYILAPVFNEFIKYSTEKQIRFFILFFYIFQTLYGWVSNQTAFFLDGLSPFSFIGLYSLGRYINLFPNKFTTRSVKFDFLIWITLTTFISLIAFVSGYYGYFINRMYSYINPFVILSALYLLLLFSKLKIQNKLINFIAASSFAVFLLHTNPNIYEPYFQRYIKVLFNQKSGFEYTLWITCLLIGTFICAILIDQIRKISWNKILHIYDKYSQ